MKLEVGMYVRTINGKIWIITSQKAIYGHRKDIIKASHNIIDLIEVGDYVNGLPVRFVEESRVDIGQAEDYFWLKNQHIKSIVTHEQLEQMEYKVGE